MMKEPAFVESGVGDRSLRFSNAQRRAFMLSWLPSTDTTTTPRFPYSDIALLDLVWIGLLTSLLLSFMLPLTFFLVASSFVDFLFGLSLNFILYLA
jgi:hypothetical protein